MFEFSLAVMFFSKQFLKSSFVSTAKCVVSVQMIVAARGDSFRSANSPNDYPSDFSPTFLFIRSLITSLPCSSSLPYFPYCNLSISIFLLTQSFLYSTACSNLHFAGRSSRHFFPQSCSLHFFKTDLEGISFSNFPTSSSARLS